MKKILIIIGSILVTIGIALAIILPIVLSGGKEDAYRSIKALQFEGNPLCIRDENELEIYQNMNFRNKDKIKTNDNSYLILKLNEKLLKIL